MKLNKQRIQFAKEKNGDAIIEILPATDERNLRSMRLWLAAWTICGLIIIPQLFFDYPRDQKLFMVVYLAFWAFFEFRILNVYRWRKQGKEILHISNDTLSYTRSVAGRGIPKVFSKSDVSSLKAEKQERKSIFNEIENSTLSAGNESLHFDYKGKRQGLGLQLAYNDAVNLAALINKFI